MIYNQQHKVIKCSVLYSILLRSFSSELICLTNNFLFAKLLRVKITLRYVKRDAKIANVKYI